MQLERGRVAMVSLGRHAVRAWEGCYGLVRYVTDSMQLEIGRVAALVQVLSAHCKPCPSRWMLTAA